MLTISSIFASAGCGDDVAGKGRRLGILNAGVDLPPYPTECRSGTEHAALVEGAELLTLLKRERSQLNKANRKAAECGPVFYDSVVAEFEKAPRTGEPLPNELRR